MDTITPLSPLLSSVPTEIVELILSNLDLPSLAACVRINRAWNELCTPHLWRTLDIDNGKRLERFMTDETQSALARNAGHIRELKLKYMSIYNIFAPTVDRSDSVHTTTDSRVSQCTNLRRLDLLLHEDPKRDPNGQWDYDWPWQFSDRSFDSVLDEAVASLIRRNPGLTMLMVEKATCFKTLLPLVVHDLPHLESLEPNDLQNGPASSDAEIAEYIRLSAQWKVIYLQNCRSTGPLAAATILDNCDHLESLYLVGCGGVSSGEILAILGKAKHLRAFAALDYHYTVDANDPLISAADFITMEWGSRLFIKFECMIEVPRSTYDAVEEQEGSSIESDAIAAGNASR
ncbi:hypothetical protein BG000_008962 [Podila horticola]|nr:hypothetical protein BG000_008962 [Podila horticola]